MPDLLIAAIARMGGAAAAEKIMAQCDLETSRLTLFTAENVPEVSTPLRIHSIPRHGSADTQRVDYLKDIGIFPDAAHYYNIAIDEGRSVITYNTGADEAPFIEEQFRTCGFVKVRRFPLARTFAGAVC